MDAIQTDETRVCIECGRPFTFNVKQQQKFKKKGYPAPKRCRSCLRGNQPNIGPEIAKSVIDMQVVLQNGLRKIDARLDRIETLLTGDSNGDDEEKDDEEKTV